MGNEIFLKKKNILILAFTELVDQPRIYRQIRFLQDLYDIVTAGFNEPRNENIRHIKIKAPTNYFLRDKIPAALLMKCGYIEKCYWNLPIVKEGLKALSDSNELDFDLIIAHDLITLPVALLFAKKNGAKVLLDLHEYFPHQFDDLWINRFFYNKLWNHICFNYLSEADFIITVCKGIADEYKKNYGINPEVITNTPYFFNLTPSVTKEDKIRIIYHGLVHKSRKSENMIYLMDHLDSRFELDFMIIRDNSIYCKKICDLAVNHPRISLRDTVSMPQIPFIINNYDIGLYLLPPESFNHRMALPNKLFEFIQGRLAIAIWPSPEMAKIVDEYKCGIVSEDFTIDSIANRLNSLSAKDIIKFKQNSHKAAAFLCAEKNHEAFLSIVNKLLYS